MAYDYNPTNVNASVADLMAKLYGTTTPTAQPVGVLAPTTPQMSVAPAANMSVAPGGMSVAPRYAPAPTAPVATGGPTGAPALGVESTKFNLQGRDYYTNLLANGTPAEKTAAAIWLRNNPVVSATTGAAKTTGGTTTGGTTTGTGTGTGTTTGTGTGTGTGTDTTVPQTYTHTLSAQDIIDQGYTIPTQMAEPDPDAIYQSQLKRVQSEIDAANSLYNDMLVQSRARLAPIQQARTQQGFISNVRGGTIGSGFDTGVNESINAANAAETKAEEDVINEKRAQALAAIRGQARTSAENELTYQREQKSKNADAIIAEINSRPQRKSAALSPVILDMIKKGVDPSKMKPEDLADLAKSFGKLNVTPEDISAEYSKQLTAQTTAKTAAEKDQADLAKTKAETDKLNAEIKAGKWITIGDGSKIYNPETGQTVENPKTFAPNSEKTAVTYDSKTIPVSVKSELLQDLSANASAKKKERKTLNQFLAAYPEVDTKYLTDLYEANQ